MVGPSYGGGIQLVTASIDERVDAIVPSITYHSLTTSLYRNEAFRSSWGTLLSAALVGTGARINPRILPAAVNGLLTGAVSEADLDLLTERNPMVSDITVPTLLIHGTIDTVFSLQEAMDTAEVLVANGVPTKMLWFCGGHGVCLNNLTDFSDGALIEQRTLEWLDRYVKGDLSVSTGPQFEWVDQKGQWFASDLMPFDPDFRGAPIAVVRSGGVLPLVPIVGGSGIPLIPLAFPAINAVNLTVPAATTPTHLVGAPELTLTYSGIGSSRHVYAQLVDDTTGLVLGSIVTPIPVTLDGQTHTVTIPLEPVTHTLAPGQTVTLQLVASAGLYTLVTSPGVLNVSNMALVLRPPTPRRFRRRPRPRSRWRRSCINAVAAHDGRVRPVEGSVHRGRHHQPFIGTSNLGPGSQDIVEQSVAQAEFSWIADQVETQLVHHISESDTGVWVGKSERAAGPGRSKRIV